MPFDEDDTIVTMAPTMNSDNPDKSVGHLRI
jgi:hypothetical protein